MVSKFNQPQSIMLIDDNKVALLLCRKIIEKVNIFDEIISFQNPIYAIRHLQALEANKDLLPDIILLDLQMPEMDGFEFLDHFKNIQKEYRQNSHILILTSSIDENDAEKIRKQKIVHKLLDKPLMLDTIISIINELYPSFEYPLRGYKGTL
ncbi:MAG TPA: response regulator [Niabella sp.]|nr:response regulator [Niabella sp.]HQW14580.1 response regulator [Niabella sp.]HQX19721.1 response regulator [Niabella sp.]HQX41704.1 response regulator [Niabella sp.]HRB07542.1 response regulator [Niabella sp.]